MEPQRRDRYFAFAFGVIFVSVLLVLAVMLPHPSSAQYATFRIVLALAAAGVASVVPGFIQVEVSTVVKAGGALAVFTIVFFFSPARLVISDSPNEGKDSVQPASSK